MFLGNAFDSPYITVTKTKFSGCLVLTVQVSILLLNSMSLMWLTIWFCLYPLCLSLCNNLSVIDLVQVLFELVLRYLFFSPLIIALMGEGG